MSGDESDRDCSATGNPEEQAAALYLRRQRPDWGPEDQAQLESWLSNPAHRAAFRKVMRAWQRIESHAASPELIGLRAQTLHRTQRRPGPGRWLRPAADRWQWAAGALLALLLGVALHPLLSSHGEVSYRTAFGQRRVIELADHSQVAMDQRSALRVRMSRDARAVDLVEGQAQFMVAHDAHRPFLVKAGASTITAVGTSFNVEYLDARMRLDMVEGRVVVAVGHPASAGNLHDAVSRRSDRTLNLSAGEELDVGPGGTTQIVHNVDVGAATAWRQGRIIFNNTPLGEAVRRLNRYSRIQLRIEGPALEQERINGVFELGDAMVFAEAMQSSLAVTVRQSNPGELILSPAP